MVVPTVVAQDAGQLPSPSSQLAFSTCMWIPAPPVPTTRVDWTQIFPVAVPWGRLLPGTSGV